MIDELYYRLPQRYINTKGRSFAQHRTDIDGVLEQSGDVFDDAEP